ncbi:phospholipid scramblase 1-like [Dendropsophus ebraccatus]|uniref:phospholipid scramblase 1-like n=1 Tax=Dendropsophus ebraccatus TaxID=150705 RepID=UPI00383222AF
MEPNGVTNYGFYGEGSTIQNQPPNAGDPPNLWMPRPAEIPNCPPGVEYLCQIDQLIIRQKTELLEVFTGFETNNKYEITNSMGQKVYYAAEETSFCNRFFCGSARSFVIVITDNRGNEVMRLLRPLRCSCCLAPCCLQRLEVQAPPGIPIGYVIQTWHPFLPKFTIQNERHENVLRIIGPFLTCSCCSDVNFMVKSVDEIYEVGRISKQWAGFVNEMCTDADIFGIQFPMNLDVKMKAVMLGACFLIDFMFFEYSEQKDGAVFPVFT